MIRLFSFLYAEWIDIRDGKAIARKGRFSHRVLMEIGEVVSNGSIRSTGDGRYLFSSDIPESLHQNLRNILTSR